MYKLAIHTIQGRHLHWVMTFSGTASHWTCHRSSLMPSGPWMFIVFLLSICEHDWYANGILSIRVLKFAFVHCEVIIQGTFFHEVYVIWCSRDPKIVCTNDTSSWQETLAGEGRPRWKRIWRLGQVLGCLKLVRKLVAWNYWSTCWLFELRWQPADFCGWRQGAQEDPLTFDLRIRKSFT